MQKLAALYCRNSAPRGPGWGKFLTASMVGKP